MLLFFQGDQILFEFVVDKKRKFELLVQKFLCCMCRYDSKHVAFK